MEEKVQGLKSINGRYKIDTGMLRTVKEMEKPKNLCAQPIVMNLKGNCWREGGTGNSGAKG